jgi:hypothetical protein
MIKGNKHRTFLPDGSEVWSSDRYPLVDPEIATAAILDIKRAMN